jgi:hypothetical protein
MIPHFDLTDAERASAAWEAYQCQNLMARFTQYQELGQERAQFDALWANRPDISLGENEGFWVGREAVYRAWVQGREEGRQKDLALLQAADPAVPTDAPGSLERVNLMSPLVEVARDGQTAKGMWYCPGVTTQSEVDGKMHLTWLYTRYGVDFIKEGEDWRLWHVFVGSEFQFELGHAYIPATGMKPLPDATVYAPNPKCQGLPLGRTAKPAYDLPMHLYGIDYGWSPYPMVPVPYETFAETFSYGPEPFMTAEKEDSHEQ